MPSFPGDSGSPRWFLAKLAEGRASFRAFWSILSLTPFDTTTPEGRSNERYRRAALSTLTSMISRGLGIFTGLATLRISIGYLGKERYGLWTAVGSLIAWANLADLGLARGMQNHLSHANGRDDKELAARYVSTGIVALALIALGLACVATPVVLTVPWSATPSRSGVGRGSAKRGYWFAPYGLFGVVVATSIFSLVVSAWLFPLACRDLLRRTRLAGPAATTAVSPFRNGAPSMVRTEVQS